MTSHDRPTDPQRPTALADEAFEVLREDLLTGGPLTAGRRLVAEDLAKRLGMSRTPVREALHRLSQRGFLTALDGGGYERRRFRTRDIRDLYEIRRLLEPYAAALAADERRVPGTTASTSFHSAVARAAGNRALAHVIELLYERVAALRIGSQMDQATPTAPRAMAGTRVRAGHARIARAVEAGEREAAHRAMDRHVAAEARSLLRRRRRHTPSDAPDGAAGR